MADKVEKPKKSKPKAKKDDKGVLAALPSTRPERIGGRRASGPKTFEQPEAAQAAARGAKKPAATRASAAKSSTATTPSAKSSTASSSAGKRSAPRATAARRKAAAPRTFEPTPAAEAAAGAADERAAGATRPRPAPEPRPRAVREAAPGMGTTGAREQPSPESGRPSGVELVTTAVQAAGELTQIGLTIGGKLVKRVVDRLPKP